MPNVTIQSRPARSAAVAEAFWNASTLSTMWSAGSTIMIGSSSDCPASERAASVSAGAVFRPTGSRSIDWGTQPTCLECSAARKRCSSLHTMIGAVAS